MFRVGCNYNSGKIENMIGVTMISVVEEGNYRDQLKFRAEDGRAFVFHHVQDCCESVSIEDITGDLADLVGSPILRAEERSNSGDDPSGYGTQTYTFYEFATIKGSVTVRWLGESNGYYSESVDFTELSKEEVNKQTT